MRRIARNLAVGILLGIWTASSFATGGHYIPPVVKPVVVPTTVTPPVVPPVTPTPPIATTPPSAPPQPSQQPAGGKGPGAAGWIAMGVVIAYFGETIRQHYLFCAQREEQWHKDNKVPRCYNAEKDGLPR